MFEYEFAAKAEKVKKFHFLIDPFFGHETERNLYMLSAMTESYAPVNTLVATSQLKGFILLPKAVEAVHIIYHVCHGENMYSTAYGKFLAEFNRQISVIKKFPSRGGTEILFNPNNEMWEVTHTFLWSVFMPMFYIKVKHKNTSMGTP
jgi:hypothetical protein